MVLEIDRLKHGKNGLKRRAKSANHMDVFVKRLEEERDYWKGEVDVLQALMKRGSLSRTSSPVRSPVRSPTRSRSPSKSTSRSASPSRIKSPKNSGKQVRDICLIIKQQK